jgi:hypothetical protein
MPAWIRRTSALGSIIGARYLSDRAPRRTIEPAGLHPGRLTGSMKVRLLEE